MRRVIIISLLLIIYFAAVSSLPPDKSERTLFTLMKKLFGYGSKCGSRSCPPWKCQDDSAIIHGYCCHCPGSQNHNVPIPCYPDLKCPVSAEPLCSDYTFMIECCCTGP